MPLDSTTNDTSLWNFVGPALQIGAGLYGSVHGSGQVAGGYNNAYNSAQTAINTSGAALAPYQTVGTGAAGALANLYGLGGVAPNFSAFTDSPGYKFEQQQGENAINRAAAASGNAFSSTTLAQLGAYDQGLAATHYQQYLQGLYGLYGVGSNAAIARGGQALTGAGIAGGYQVGSGVARGAGSVGVADTLGQGLAKFPWQKVGSYLSPSTDPSTASGVADMASYFGSDYGTGGYNGITAAAANGYGADTAFMDLSGNAADAGTMTNLTDLYGGGFNGAGGQAAAPRRPQQQANPVQTGMQLYGDYNKGVKAYNFLTGAGNIGASADAAATQAVGDISSQLTVSPLTAEQLGLSTGANVAGAAAAGEPALASIGTSAVDSAVASSSADAAAALGATDAGAGAASGGAAAGGASSGVGAAAAATLPWLAAGLAVAAPFYGLTQDAVSLSPKYWNGMASNLQGGKSNPQFWGAALQALNMPQEQIPQNIQQLVYQSGLLQPGQPWGIKNQNLTGMLYGGGSGRTISQNRS